MKLFGQFLIDQGMITKEDFVKAMIFQADELPSLPDAVNELKLLTIDQQVAVFDYQSTHLKDYRVSCIELGFWDEAYFEHALIRYYLTKMQALGEILVKQGRVSTKQLAEALARYVELGDFTAGDASKLKAKMEVKVDPRPTPTGPKEGKVINIADYRTDHIELDKFSAAEATLCYLYCRHFNEKRFANFLELAEHPNEEIKIKAKRDLNAIRTAASLIRAERSKDLAEKLLGVLTEKASDAPEIKSVVDQAARVLWDLREYFSAGVPEWLAFQEDPPLFERMKESFTSLTKIG